MEQLKKILRQALASDAQKLRLASGAHIEVTSALGTQQFAAETPVDDAYLHKLFGFLFPNEKPQIAQRQVVKGQLAIPNVGRLLLIGQPQSPSALMIYVGPQGQQHFDADWARMQSRTVATPAEAAPVAMRAPMAPVGFIPAGMGDMGGGVAPMAQQPQQQQQPSPQMGGGFPAMTSLPFPGGAPQGAAQPPQPMGGLPPMTSLPFPGAAQQQQQQQQPHQHQAPMTSLPFPGAAPMGVPQQQQQQQQQLQQQAPMTSLPFLGAAPAPQLPDLAQGPGPQMGGMLPFPSAAPAPMPAPAPQMGGMPFSTAPMAHAPFPDPIPSPHYAGGGGGSAPKSFDQIEIDYSPPPARHASGGGSHGAAPADDGPIHIEFSADNGAVDVSTGKNPIDPILIDMVKRRASDLHMTCGEPYCYRVDGEIQRIGQGAVGPDQMEVYLLPMMPERNQREFMKINDTDFAYEIKGVGRFRVNVFRDKNGVGTVMRHIPSKILTAEQLGLPPAITKFCALTKGLVVVTGPTGSGKSTTLAAMVDLINKQRHDHILTVEDPIEFVHTQQKCLVNQREVHRHTGSFSRALKAALREDPDIVLVGEMRDLETVAIAIETAETGHLVFGTLHTNTAVSTVDRIVQQFPHEQQEAIRMMLASSLKGVVAQTLLKKKGGGRVAAHEILVVNDAVSAMIREGKNHMIPNHMQTQKVDGNLMLTESLAKLVKDGVVDVEEALRKAVDKVSMMESLKRLGIRFADPNAGVAPVQPGRRPA